MQEDALEYTVRLSLGKFTPYKFLFFCALPQVLHIFHNGLKFSKKEVLFLFQFWIFYKPLNTPVFLMIKNEWSEGKSVSSYSKVCVFKALVLSAANRDSLALRGRQLRPGRSDMLCAKCSSNWSTMNTYDSGEMVRSKLLKVQIFISAWVQTHSSCELWPNPPFFARVILFTVSFLAVFKLGGNTSWWKSFPAQITPLGSSLA